MSKEIVVCGEEDLYACRAELAERRHEIEHQLWIQAAFGLIPKQDSAMFDRSIGDQLGEDLNLAPALGHETGFALAIPHVDVEATVLERCRSLR